MRESGENTLKKNYGKVYEVEKINEGDKIT